MIFWIIIALLLSVAMLIVAVPLWRGGAKNNVVERDAANLEIFRDQMTEMDADLRNGLLTQAMHEQGKQELQSRLLDEVEHVPSDGKAITSNPFKMLALVLTFVLPITVIGIYLLVGNHHAILQQESAVSADAELKLLQEKVTGNPDDAESLLLLARTYTDMTRYQEAAQSYEKLTQMVPNEAQLWADYADVLSMASGKTLLGKATLLLDKALALDPDNFKALALSGSAAMERGDYAVTVRLWEKLVKMIPKENENVKMVEDGIQHARELMAQKGDKPALAKGNTPSAKKKDSAVQAGKEAISGIVTLSEALKARTNPDDTVFVLVRASAGPKMPLAIVRKQVRDLPYKFTLDDSTAMSPEMKVSNFDQVVVIARVSKSGNAMAQAGDLHGMSAVIKPGSKGLKLSIDKIAP